eukprot:gene6515-14738_t
MRHSLVLLIVFSAIVFVFDALLACVEVRLLAGPVRRLARNMRRVEEMRLDDVEAEEAGRLSLAEMHTIWAAFATMVARLRVLREFIPQAALVADASDDDVALVDLAAAAGARAARKERVADVAAFFVAELLLFAPAPHRPYKGVESAKDVKSGVKSAEEGNVFSNRSVSLLCVNVVGYTAAILRAD